MFVSILETSGTTRPAPADTDPQPFQFANTTTCTVGLLPCSVTREGCLPTILLDRHCPSPVYGPRCTFKHKGEAQGYRADWRPPPNFHYSVHIQRLQCSGQYSFSGWEVYRLCRIRLGSSYRSWKQPGQSLPFAGRRDLPAKEFRFSLTVMAAAVYSGQLKPLSTDNHQYLLATGIRSITTTFGLTACLAIAFDSWKPL